MVVDFSLGGECHSVLASAADAEWTGGLLGSDHGVGERGSGGPVLECVQPSNDGVVTSVQVDLGH